MQAVCVFLQHQLRAVMAAWLCVALFVLSVYSMHS